MIRTILCPTDFSPAAGNAVEYAAKLAQKLNAAMELLFVLPMQATEGVSLFANVKMESVKESQQAMHLLDDICRNVKQEFHVACKYEVLPSLFTSTEKVIAQQTAGYDLTILGTNGADTLGQLYFGSHSFRVAWNETGPVLIVPATFAFREFNRIVFVAEYEKCETNMLEALKQLSMAFHSTIRVVHISSADSELSREVYRSFCHLTDEALRYDQQVTFERIVHEDKAEAIETFARETKADLVAMHLKKHGLVYRLFHEDLLKKVTGDAEFPVLVFPHSID